jgi:hypothetical protein
MVGDNTISARRDYSFSADVCYCMQSHQKRLHSSGWSGGTSTSKKQTWVRGSCRLAGQRTANIEYMGFDCTDCCPVHLLLPFRTTATGSSQLARQRMLALTPSHLFLGNHSLQVPHCRS